MSFEIALSWITAVFLCSVRLGALLLMTPILEGFSVPARVRVLLVLALSTVLVSTLNLTPASLPSTFGHILVAAVAELATGALLAYGIFTAFAAVAFAGKALDIQMGFGLGNVYDPVTRTQSPLLGSILGLLAVLLFFVTEAHHALLRGLAFSLEKVPLGGVVSELAPELIVRQFGTVFSLGLLLAAPVMFCLFLVEIGLAVLSRNLPQMNLFVVSIPAKIVTGLAILAFIGGRLESVFAKIFGSIFAFWEAVL